jgi:hypothetical protein
MLIDTNNLQMNKDILYQIGLYINDDKTFFSFIISIKGIENKDKLISFKKEEFKKLIIDKNKKYSLYNINLT